MYYDGGEGTNLRNAIRVSTDGCLGNVIRVSQMVA